MLHCVILQSDLTKLKSSISYILICINWMITSANRDISLSTPRPNGQKHWMPFICLMLQCEEGTPQNKLKLKFGYLVMSYVSACNFKKLLCKGFLFLWSGRYDSCWSNATVCRWSGWIFALNIVHILKWHNFHWVTWELTDIQYKHLNLHQLELNGIR